MSKAAILLCGPPQAALGGGPTHIRNMMASPLKDRYRFIHFETGSRGIESPAREEAIFAKVYRLITSPIVFTWMILHSWPTVVHLNSVADHKAFWRDLVYVLIGKLFRRRVILQLHGGSLSSLCSGKWTELVVRVTFSLLDAVVLLAASEKRDLEKMGVKERLYIVPNAVDLSEYSESAERIHSGRVQQCVYMGRLVREKGIIEAIEAIRILRLEERFQDIELRIAGTGPAKEDIEKLINHHNLGSCVKLVGSVYGSEKIKFLQEADVFVFPSYHPEGLPYSILESMASGTPVIASRVAGIPDAVIDGVHGILVNTKDPGDIVRAIRLLGQSQDALRKMSTNCVAWAAQKFGLERLANQFGDLYEKVRA